LSGDFSTCDSSFCSSPSSPSIRYSRPPTWIRKAIAFVRNEIRMEKIDTMKSTQDRTGRTRISKAGRVSPRGGCFRINPKNDTENAKNVEERVIMVFS